MGDKVMTKSQRVLPFKEPLSGEDRFTHQSSKIDVYYYYYYQRLGIDWILELLDGRGRTAFSVTLWLKNQLGKLLLVLPIPTTRILPFHSNLQIKFWL